MNSIVDIASRFRSSTYRLGQKIGEGGFAQVYQADNLITGQAVAIKFLIINPDYSESKKRRHIDRFERETLLVSQLEHPNIVRLLDKGECESEYAFAVYELSEGQTLKQLLAEVGSFSPLDAAEIMSQVLDALAYAHSKGIVHRDIKPANIIISSTSAKYHAKILDFGIGTFVNEARHLDYKSITLTQETLGTPSYSAPEQLRGEAPTFKSDLYVWGLVFIECLTGTPTISGTNLASIFHKQLSPNNVPLPAAIAGHPVANLFNRVLQKKTNERAGDAAEIYKDLKQINFSTLVGELSSPITSSPASAVITGNFSDQATMIQENTVLHTSYTEQKQITVMCITLKVKTLIEDSLDREVIDALHRDQKAQCVDIATRYSGLHVGTLGDTLLFYFGYPAATENDGRLCIRSALDIVSGVNQRNILLKTTQGVQACVHIGVHTGFMITYPDMLPEGDTANIAMELARASQTNQILCSESSFKVLSGYLEFESAPALCVGVGNKESPVYSIVGERIVEAFGFLRASYRHQSFVGRHNELQQLQALLKVGEISVLDNLQSAHIYGEAGVGKSRLAYELRQLANGFTHYVAQCLPEYRNNALHPILHILRYKYSLFILDPDTAIERLRSVLLESDNVEFKQAILVLCIWLNYMPPDGNLEPEAGPESLKRLLFKTLTYLLCYCGEEAKFNSLFLLEDIHWADPTSLEFIKYFLSSEDFKSSSHVFVSTSREARPNSLVDHINLDIRLDKFDIKESESYLYQLLDNQPIAPKVVEFIVSRTDGIPLFIEEFVTMLQQKRLIQRFNGIMDFTGPQSSVNVPNTLRDSLQQNLDSLHHAKETAQIAAAIGREFEYGLLLASSDYDDAQLQVNMEELLASGLVYKQRKVRGDSFIFKHALIRDAAYDSLPNSRRKDTHRRIAESLEQQFSPSMPDIASLIALHWGEAEHFGKAIEFGNLSASNALKRSSAAEAIAQAKKCEDWVAHLDSAAQIPQRLEINRLLTSAFMETKGWGSDEVKHYSQSSLELLKADSNKDQLVPHLWWQVLNGVVSGNRQHLAKLHEETEILVPNVCAINESAIKCAQGFYLFTNGNIANCITTLEEAIAAYDDTADKSHQQTFGFDVRVFAKATLARAYAFQNDERRSCDLSEEAVNEAKSYDHVPSIGIALMYHGLVYQQFQNHSKVADSSSGLIAIAEKYDLPIYKGFGQMLYDWSAHDASQADEILSFLKSAGSRHGLGHFQSLYAETYYNQGELRKALAKIEECIALDSSIKEDNYLAFLYFQKGMYLLASSDADQNSIRIALTKAKGLAEEQAVYFIYSKAENLLDQMNADQNVAV